MTEPMTIEQVRDWHRKTASSWDNTQPRIKLHDIWKRQHLDMADAITAHIAKPDLRVLGLDTWNTYYGRIPTEKDLLDKRIKNAQARIISFKITPENLLRVEEFLGCSGEVSDERG